MSQTASNNSANSTPITTVPDTWETIPCVQYGFPEDKGPVRAPKLSTIFEPIPENAVTVSPVYGLTRDQYERQQRLGTGYEVAGDYKLIATELQKECETSGRVLYPIHIESDVYLEEGPSTLIEWFREFVEDYLDVSFHTCWLYFSGHRSIHVHVPRFVSGEQARERLRKQTKKFCEEADAKLDCGIYDPKRLFRLPSVEHAKTGLRKVEIEPEWEHERIIQEAATSTADAPESYEAILRQVFLIPSLMKETAQLAAYTPHTLFQVLDSNKTVLEFELDEKEIETPLIEQKEYPDHAEGALKWLQYNAKEFSPYALSSGNGRSVAVITVKGTPFARKDVTGGSFRRPVHALIPAYFYGARGCSGEEFIKDHEHAPLQLSKPDYEKWEKQGFQTGDHVVIIGGKSNRSRIFRVSSWQATVVGHALTGNNASRQSALNYLENEGYDVGKSGNSGNLPPSKSEGARRRCMTSSQSTGETEAARLQHQAERDGISTLGFREVSNVANRLLRIGGWTLAWEWLEEQYGTQFHSENTWTRLKGIVEYYDDLNVEVPPKPR